VKKLSEESSNELNEESSEELKDESPTAPANASQPPTEAVAKDRARMQAGTEVIAQDMASGAARPVHRSGTLEQLIALARYMTRTEVHTYAFSVAAQVILSLFPFIVLLLTVSQRVFHSVAMADVVSQMMENLLPNNQEFVMRNMRALATAHAGTRIFSIVVLLITTTGVFLPLEVALNSVWGVTKNRNYLMNQLVSIVLATGVGLLAMASVAVTAAQRVVLGWLFFGHTDNLVYRILGRGFLELCATAAGIGIFFLIYWGLPNRKVPPRAVLPTAVVTGLLWEAAKYAYVWVLPRLDFAAVYGPFRVTVGIMMWAFLSGLLLLAGAYVSATREALREAREADLAG
jgi:membrane protein